MLFRLHAILFPAVFRTVRCGGHAVFDLSNIDTNQVDSVDRHECTDTGTDTPFSLEH